MAVLLAGLVQLLHHVRDTTVPPGRAVDRTAVLRGEPTDKAPENHQGSGRIRGLSCRTWAMVSLPSGKNGVCFRSGIPRLTTRFQG